MTAPGTGSRQKRLANVVGPTVWPQLWRTAQCAIATSLRVRSYVQTVPVEILLFQCEMGEWNESPIRTISSSFSGSGGSEQRFA